MRFTSQLTLVLTAGLLISRLSAQTYVANLDNSMGSSTFEGITQQSLAGAGIGWSVVSGSNVIIYDGASNNVVIDIGSQFGSYEVAYITSTPLVANSTYTLSFNMGYVSGVYLGKASYAFELDTYNGSYTVLNSTSGGPVNTNVGGFSSSNISGSVTASLTFTTGASINPTDYIAIKWSSTNAGTTSMVDADFFGFDNATLSYLPAAIPEPSTYAAIFGGLALAGAMIVRRRQARA